MPNSFVVSKHLGMFLDEADDVKILLFRWLKATGSVGGNKEFIATHTAAIASDADIRLIVMPSRLLSW